MDEFNSQFNLICKTFPKVYGTGKYQYNKKYQLKTRIEDTNDDSDMKRYFQALCVGDFELSRSHFQTE